MSFNPSTVNDLVVFTHGEFKSLSLASIAVLYEEPWYLDLDLFGLLPAEFMPFDGEMAGYWAIARTLKQVPYKSNITIKSANEACISTINLLLQQQEANATIKHEAYSHQRLVHRIMLEVHHRKELGCWTQFEFVDTRDVPLKSGSEDAAVWLEARKKTLEVRRIAQKAIKDAESKGSASNEDVAATFDKSRPSPPRSISQKVIKDAGATKSASNEDVAATFDKLSCASAASSTK